MTAIFSMFFFVVFVVFLFFVVVYTSGNEILMLLKVLCLSLSQIRGCIVMTGLDHKLIISK